MADLLTNEGWVKAGSASSYLRESLPDDYIVVANPRVAGHPLSAAVVGRGNLFVVEDFEGDPEDAAAASAASKKNGRGAVGAAYAFLKEEFPALQAPVVGVRGARDWAEGPVTWRVVEPPEWADLTLADAILSADLETTVFASQRAREELALGLRDRQITASEATRRPFVFRSGGALRTGARAATVRDALRHMDRHPADGIQVLRDGTLAAWFEEEGALHLAALAREAVRQPKADARVALESFLMGSGLVTRPQLVAQPAAVDLGYVAQGCKVAHRLRLEAVRGSRGHLFGAIAGGELWLRVEPREFAGAPVELIVTAETDRLEICPDPYVSTVNVTSSARADPLTIPVTVRVVTEPPALIRYVVRPLTGALVAALIGAGLSLLWRVTGLVRAEEAVLWIAVVTGLWGGAGAVRGLRQPPAWPLRYALGRWLGKTLAWSLALAALAVILVQAWKLGLGGGLEFAGLTLAAAAVGGAAFGFGPATLDELARSRHARDPNYTHGSASMRRPMLISAGLVALVLVALLTPRLVVGVWSKTNTQSIVRSGGSWVEQRLEGLGEAIDRLIDGATLRYYDRREGGSPAPEGPGLKLPRFLGGG